MGRNIPLGQARFERVERDRRATPPGATATAFDGDAIHSNVPGEVNALTLKGVPVAADVFLIEDSASSYSKKKVTLTALSAVLGVADADYGDITVSSSGTVWTVDVDIVKAWTALHDFGGGISSKRSFVTGPFILYDKLDSTNASLLMKSEVVTGSVGQQAAFTLEASANGGVGAGPDIHTKWLDRNASAVMVLGGPDWDTYGAAGTYYAAAFGNGHLLKDNDVDNPYLTAKEAQHPQASWTIEGGTWDFSAATAALGVNQTVALDNPGPPEVGRYTLWLKQNGGLQGGRALMIDWSGGGVWSIFREE